MLKTSDSSENDSLSEDSIDDEVSALISKTTKIYCIKQKDFLTKDDLKQHNTF